MAVTSETRETLHHSILHYLHQSGFTKTLKRFQSEAGIKDDTWKACSVNLEDVYCKYINSCSKTEDNADVETETKAKKKKKNKHDVSSGDEVKETKPEAVNDLEVNESNKKHNDKKKKKSKEIEDVDLNIEQEVKEEKKSSKKRKRLLSDEKETNQTVAKENEIDETSTRKNEKSEINREEKSGSQKSGKKQRVGSAEPKTVNAFQRVKIDQVEFAHEKLQDNSYWAKDGADVGYGAKAQEVLGQVRGKGFRHEKTKKKRGSYRGGQIDLQLHSIKFNYDDEE